MSIKQAIEALLHVRDCTYIDDNGRTALMNIYDPEHVDAALAALRSMPAEPVAWQVRAFYTGVVNEWQPWRIVDADNLPLWQRRNQQFPHLYALRPLYAQPTTPPTAPVLSDAEWFQFIAESKSGTIRLDGDPGNPKDYRFAAPHYIHWCEPEMPLRTAIEQAIGRASRGAK